MKRRLPLSNLHCNSSQYCVGAHCWKPQLGLEALGYYHFFFYELYCGQTNHTHHLALQPCHLPPSPSGATYSSLVPVPTSNGVIDVDSFPFKSKCFMPVFSDLRYLAHTLQVQALIASLATYLHQFATTCRLFMCLNPNKRAVKTHVEYKTDAWISIFNVTLSLSRVIKVYREAFGGKVGSGTLELVGAIGTVMHHIFMVCTLVEDCLDQVPTTFISYCLIWR